MSNNHALKIEELRIELRDEIKFIEADIRHIDDIICKALTWKQFQHWHFNRVLKSRSKRLIALNEKRKAHMARLKPLKRRYMMVLDTLDLETRSA
jgi:hypothetical protein